MVKVRIYARKSPQYELINETKIQRLKTKLRNINSENYQFIKKPVSFPDSMVASNSLIGHNIHLSCGNNQNFLQYAECF
jgi:hypothetical protein